MDRVTGERVLGHYGTGDPGEAFRRLVEDQKRLGFGSKSETLERLLGVGLASMNRWREARTHPEFHLRPDPVLAGALSTLAGRFRLILGTNNAPGLARRILASLGVDAGLFQAVLTSEDAGAAKPQKEFFEAAAAAAGVPAAAFVSVGDQEDSDLAPARDLGMGTWLVASRADVYRLADARP